MGFQQNVELPQVSGKDGSGGMKGHRALQAQTMFVDQKVVSVAVVQWVKDRCCGS